MARLEVAPPVGDWGAEELAVDALHHLVYLLAISVAYAGLDRT